METLWPGQAPAAAANSLYQVVHAARQALNSAHEQGGRSLQFERDHICLCPETPLWIDVEAFDAAAQEARRSVEPAAYRTALALYTGDLLPDDRYEDWADTRRTALRLTYLALLTDLARLYEARGEAAQAIETLQRVLAADPAHEAAHRALMRLYCMSGDRLQALRQYQALAEALRREVDAEPDAASQALYREIATGSAIGCVGGETPGPQPENTNSKRPGASSRRHNLPRALTSFIGREQAMTEVLHLLGATHLLTLTGPGGCGKTRLALAVATELLAAYAAGAWWVDLAPLAEPSLVPRTVAWALGVREEAGQSMAEAVANYVGEKRLLLVLDNCEHLVEACAELAQALLDACPNLTILATSREHLGVPGEIAWLVPSLAFPDPQHIPPMTELTGYEAVRLFCERSAAARGGFAMTVENAPAVAEICVRLDGMPLAIELAAARIRLLTPRQIAAGLEGRFGLLTGGARTAPPRQRTLRGMLDWSYDLLTDLEQRLFRRLAVFRGGFTLAAVEAVCEGTLDLLAQLVDKSLVVVETHEAEARYTLLETIQHFAAEKLAAKGELAWLQDRHLLFYVALAEEAEPWLKSGSANLGWRCWTARSTTCAPRWPGRAAATGSRTPGCGWPGPCCGSGASAATCKKGIGGWPRCWRAPRPVLRASCPVSLRNPTTAAGAGLAPMVHTTPIRRAEPRTALASRLVGFPITEACLGWPGARCCRIARTTLFADAALMRCIETWLMPLPPGGGHWREAHHGGLAGYCSEDRRAARRKRTARSRLQSFVTAA